LKQKFVEDAVNKSTEQDLLSSEKLKNIIAKYNNEVAPVLNPQTDAIDSFITLLPENYRRHFSLVHRSFSIQKASPMSPRVIMYGPDAKLMMTFNEGDQAVELIEWNTNAKTWDFSELKFDAQKRLVQENHPAKCVMCHAGTPKPVDMNNIEAYRGKLKPIFPQYPFWPGFYGSVNDIVGIDTATSRDTIMRNLQATFSQIKGLTFSETEELFRLRKLLDENPKYMDVVKNELDVHQKYFSKFMDSTKERNRYRHLVTLKDLYTKKGEAVPEYLKSAPYRRTFEKEYGHYLLRPNFYLSSLMTFYQSQFIADQMRKSPVYQQIKYSLLARKYNCGPIQVEGLSINDLDSSFDMLYPNLASQEARDKQYLLAYQFNVVAAAKGGQKELPLHSWNLEANEDIASYHYGNVFSDLNELVLWNLAQSHFSQLKPTHARPAAEERHYSLPNSTFFKNYLEAGGGYVSRMNEKQMNFSQTLNSYYGAKTQFKALPVSSYCDSLFIPAAKEELKKIAPFKQSNQLPHQVLVLDPRLYTLTEIIGPEKAGLNMVRQACESCHSDSSVAASQQIEPRLNVDWFSDTYYQDIHKNYVRIHGTDKTPVELKKVIDEVLSQSTLPVPYENSMPFGRRPMESFALKCELAVINANYSASAPLKGKAFDCNKEVDPNSFGCRCRKLSMAKDKLYKELYREQ
ncbi:MAG: hypothetical protein ABL930_12850, partial [Pseudobdellovibrio sp.]